MGIAVIGSLNVDLTSRVPRFLLPGETLQGLDFHTYAGGKGGNQAVAAARLREGVMMLGKLGDDTNSAVYWKAFSENGIDASCVMTEKGINTGIAVIEVDASTGNNRIILTPGANARVDAAQIDLNWDSISACDVFLLQLEIPLETNVHAIRRLRAAGKTIILDPAPAVPLPAEMLRMCDILTPNEVELAMLTGLPCETEEQMLKAGRELLASGVKKVVLKAGRRGAYLFEEGRAIRSPGFSVKAVDTTAAGDSFNAGLAAGLSDGMPIEDALRYANAVAALSTLGYGAQAAMPTRQEAEDFIKANEKGDTP